jgi:hypothetical protein
LATTIVEARGSIEWNSIVTTVHRDGHTVMGIPAKYRDMVEKANTTFRLEPVSEAASAAMFHEMYEFFNEVYGEYEAGAEVCALYTLLRLTMTAIIVAQNDTVRSHRDVSMSGVRFVDIIDDDNSLRTDRMPILVRPNTFNVIIIFISLTQEFFRRVKLWGLSCAFRKRTSLSNFISLSK